MTSTKSLGSLKNKYHWKYKKCKNKTNIYRRKSRYCRRRSISTMHCKLQPDDICGPCLCSDDNKLLTKHYCNCQNLQPKRNCLQHKQVEIKVNELYKIHQNILQTVKV